MPDPAHPAAIEHLPIFVTAPGQTDVLMTVVGIFLVGTVLLVGVLFFWLHSLPERIAHKSQKLQFEIVAVLGLLALFTHVHLFWVAALLLALVELPDFATPINRIAGSLETMAGRRRRSRPEPAGDEALVEAEAPPEPVAEKELTHA
jgi:hypothetical protein